MFIMKDLTDFRKTVETGVDPRLISGDGSVKAMELQRWRWYVVRLGRLCLMLEKAILPSSSLISTLCAPRISEPEPGQ